MYHYVRPKTNLNLYYITNKNFEKQIDYLENHYGIVSKEQWNNFRDTGRFPKGVLLTFDDGLKDHINNVIPVLTKRNLFAIFYVCTDPLYDRALSVHLTHYLLSIFPPRKIMELLQKNNIILGENIHLDSVSRHAYLNHNQDEIAKNVKRIINWAHQDLGQREKLSKIFYSLTGLSQKEFVQNWYLNQRDLLILNGLDFEIGSHTCTHRLLSNLKSSDFRNEIVNSKAELSDLVRQDIRSFCYPYGGPNSYNEGVVTELKKAGYSESFSVNPKDIDFHLNSKLNIFELPRYDCNLFPNYI
jgi:peptidoglycan/xylan/chitin deacetylase (PgdA/CDA1 family)